MNMKNVNKKDSYQQSQTDKDRSVRDVSNENKDKNASNSKGGYNKEDAGGTGLGHKKDQGKSIDQELKKQ